MTRTLSSRKQRPEHVFVLGSRAKLRLPLPERVTAWKTSEIKASVSKAPGRAVFISYGQDATDALLKLSLGAKKRLQFNQLLAIEPPRAASIPALLGIFKAVVGYGADYRWLPLDELVHVIAGDEAEHRFIGGAADHETESLALVRGDGSTLVVPFSSFEATGTGTKPDFHELSFTDYGHTVELGDYEASADAILYEADPDYRKWLKRERKRSEKSFGASLMRARLQRGLKRTDFAPLSAKTLARIERNEIDKPHGKTLEVISKCLGVPADQINSY